MIMVQYLTFKLAIGLYEDLHGKINLVFIETICGRKQYLNAPAKELIDACFLF